MMFPESCLESVSCDKLLTVFSVPRKLDVLGGVGVELAGAEAKLSACLLPYLISRPSLFMITLWEPSVLRASRVG